MNDDKGQQPVRMRDEGLGQDNHGRTPVPRVTNTTGKGLVMMAIMAVALLALVIVTAIHSFNSIKKMSNLISKQSQALASVQRSVTDFQGLIEQKNSHSEEALEKVNARVTDAMEYIGDVTDAVKNAATRDQLVQLEETVAKSSTTTKEAVEAVIKDTAKVATGLAALQKQVDKNSQQAVSLENDLLMNMFREIKRRTPESEVGKLTLEDVVKLLNNGKKDIEPKITKEYGGLPLETDLAPRVASVEETASINRQAIIAITEDKPRVPFRGLSKETRDKLRKLPLKK